MTKMLEVESFNQVTRFSSFYHATYTNKLVAQRQGPYAVVQHLGKVNYEIEMADKRKKKRIVHINTLRKWHVPLNLACLAFEVMEDSEESEDLVDWDGSCSGAEEEKPLVLRSWMSSSRQSWRNCFVSRKMFCRVSQG